MWPGDRELVAREPRVIGLAEVLDDRRLLATLRAAWPPGRPVPERAWVTYVRYKPGTQVLATVRIVLGGRAHWAMLAATDTDADAKLAKLVASAAERPGVVPAVLVPQRRLVLAPVEADRRLAGVHRLAERAGWLRSELKGAEPTVLTYKPHRRLVARLDLEGEPRAVVKVHDTRHAPAAIATLRWAHRVRCERLPLPEYLGADAEHGVVLTSWTPGTALDRRAPERERATLRAVGKLLGRLHRADPSDLPQRPVDVETDRVAEGIAAVRPDLVPSVHRALADEVVTTASPCPVHGDLSADQIVHGPQGVALIDLDRTGLGSPAGDLASWIAASLVADPWAPAVLPPALEQGYRSVGGPATPAEVAASLPAAILRRAIDPFRAREPDWSDRLEQLVLRAARSHLASAS